MLGWAANRFACAAIDERPILIIQPIRVETCARKFRFLALEPISIRLRSELLKPYEDHTYAYFKVNTNRSVL
jgi:hypothetical protein